MSRRRRVPLLVVLALALAGAGTASTLEKTGNAPPSSNSLSISQKAQSTALYCTGLTDNRGDALGQITFLNTSSSSRTLNVEAVSDTGQRATSALVLGPHASRSFRPQTLVAGHSFAVAVQVSGGGVVGEEVANGSSALAPCTTAGVTDWYGAGFNTTVGSSADLSIYNPTATSAVFNITTYSTTGFSAPSKYQGMAVGAHAQLEINLGTQVVNTSNVGVHVKVLRGSIDIVGVQGTGPVTSFNTGVTSLESTAWYPRVTTDVGAIAQIRVTNPGSLPADLSTRVGLTGYTVATQTQTIAPYSSGIVAITPNSAIPPAGYATLQLTSSVPVVTSLATGSSGPLSLSAPVRPSNSFLIADFSGKGYDAATVTNTSTTPIKVTFTTLVATGATSSTGSSELSGGSTQEILKVFKGLTSLKGATLLITSSRPTLVVTTTLPTTPAGIVVVSPLDGR